MERKTAGVTGIRRDPSSGGCSGVGLAVVVVPLVVEEGIECFGLFGSTDLTRTCDLCRAVAEDLRIEEEARS
jgi:hypothetical protein